MFLGVYTLLPICFEVCTIYQEIIDSKDVQHCFFTRVRGDYVILLVTYFVANQTVPQNISRTKILIARSGKS